MSWEAIAGLALAVTMLGAAIVNRLSTRSSRERDRSDAVSAR